MHTRTTATDFPTRPRRATGPLPSAPVEWTAKGA